MQNQKSNVFKMNLSPERTIIFIRLVKKYPLLWNPKDPDYSDKEKVQNAWKKIALYFNVSDGLLAHAKFRRLKAFYSQMLQKMARGQYGQCAYPYYFEEMEFLKPILESHHSKPQQMTSELAVKEMKEGAVGIMTDNGKTDRMYLLEVLQESEDDPSSINEENCEDSTGYSVQKYTTEGPSSKTTNSASDLPVSMFPPPRSKTHPKQFFENISSEVTSMHSGFSISSSNEFDTFGAHVATQLKLIDTISALELMSEIQFLITQTRIKNYKTITPTPSTVLNSPSSTDSKKNITKKVLTKSEDQK